MQMIEACYRLGTPEHLDTLKTQAVGQSVAEALAAMQIIPQGPQQQ